MTRRAQQIGKVGVGMCLVAVAARVVLGDTGAAGGPLTRPRVTGAPFSADAVTTVRQTLSNGTRVERIGLARYFRDREGRVRVEHVITGLDPLNSANKGQVRTIVDTDSPFGPAVYMLDPVTRTANLGPRSHVADSVGGGDTYALPLGGARWAALRFLRGGERWASFGASVSEESLADRVIDGLQTYGRRVTVVVPAGVVGYERPTEIVNERWESPELKLLIYGLSSDPRTGDIEYRLRNVRRVEPPADLFVIPSGYTMATTGDNGSTTTVFAEKDGQATKPW